MAGPFPGMDPYLEAPAIWPGVHLGLVNAAEEALNAVLPAAYVADIGERVYVVQPDRDVYPDLAVVERPSARRNAPQRAGTGVMDGSGATWVVTVEPLEVGELYVEIREVEGGRRLITVV